jgi:hypothetical protein
MRDLLVAAGEHPRLNIRQRSTLKQGSPTLAFRGGAEVWTDGDKEETGNASVFKSFMKCAGRSEIPARTVKVRAQRRERLSGNVRKKIPQ